MAETDHITDPEEESPPSEKPMGFLDHLEELRWTLIKSLLAFLVACGISAYFFNDLAKILRWPLDFGLREHPESFKAITSSPMAIFSVYLAIPLIGAVVLALPFVLFFFGQFVSPALKKNEKGLLVPGFFVGVMLFLAGAMFSYFLLVPSVVKISVQLNVEMGTELFWTIDKYYSMLMWMMIGMGAAFQFPLIIQVAVYLDFVSVAKLRSWRRIMFLICCIVAALITPTPDPVTMMLVAAPLYILYEAAIIVGAVYTERRRVDPQARISFPPMFSKVLKIVGWLLLVLVVLVGGLIAYVKLALPNVGPAPELKVEVTPERLARGEYLAHHVAACMDCHSTRDWSRYSGPLAAGKLGQGGEVFDQRFGFPGSFVSRNITPAGVGAWTDGELFRAITTGVARDGSPLFNLMPYLNYGQMDTEDIHSIIAYVRSLPPIVNEVPAHHAEFPVNILINTFPKKAALSPRPPATDGVAYGAYLVNAAGCAECHTKQEKGKKVGPLLAGGFEFSMGDGYVVRSANITPHETGIKALTKADFIARFKAFRDPAAATAVDLAKGDVQTVMPWTMFAGMTEQDLGAIYDYLRTVPAVENTIVRWTAPAPAVAPPAEKK